MLVAGVCAICCELLDCVADEISVLHCGHLFHGSCLRRWIATKANCPHCRAKVNKKQTVTRLYPDLPKENASQQVDTDTVQRDLRREREKLEKVEDELKKTIATLGTTLSERDSFHNESEELRSKLQGQNNNIRQLKTELRALKTQVADVPGLRKQVKDLKLQIRLCADVEKVLEGQKTEVEQLVQSYRDMPGKTHQLEKLAVFCVALKQEFELVKASKLTCVEELGKMKRQHHALRRQLVEKQRALDKVTHAHEEVCMSEKSLGDEVSSLKKKIDKLQQAIASPSGDSKSSAISRLIAESPAPLHLKNGLGGDLGESPVLKRRKEYLQKKENFKQPPITTPVKIVEKKTPPVKMQREKLQAFSTLYNNPSSSNAAGTSTRHFDGLGGSRTTPSLLHLREMKKWYTATDEDLLKESPKLKLLNNRFSKLKKRPKNA